MDTTMAADRMDTMETVQTMDNIDMDEVMTAEDATDAVATAGGAIEVAPDASATDSTVAAVAVGAEDTTVAAVATDIVGTSEASGTIVAIDPADATEVPLAAGAMDSGAAEAALAVEAMDGSAAKRLLPYVGIPLIAAVYLALMPAGGDWVTLARALTLIGFGYVAAYTDLRIRKVSNKLVLTMLTVWLLIMALYVFTDIEAAITLLIPSLIGGAAGGGFFLVMYLVSSKGIGGGDIKLITAVGLLLTFTKLMPMLFISSLITALVAGGLLLTKRATMKTAIPLVPFLYAGILVVLFIK